jgi:hypothetical protein
MDDDSDNISIDSEGSVTITGAMDVATNRIVSWPSVPAKIIIDQGKIITISLDHEETDNTLVVAIKLYMELLLH